MRKHRRPFLIVLTLGLLATATRSIASADDVEAFFGAQTDYSSYVYAGATVALPGATIGKGFGLRGLAVTGGYDYLSGSLGTVHAGFTGGELDAVYMVSHSNFWNDFGVGVNNTNTYLNPYDPSNPLRGGQVEMRVLTDGGTDTGPWRVDWNGYYGTRLHDYLWQLGGTHSLSSKWRLGVDLYGEGNPTYDLHEVGPYAGLALGGDKGELTFSAGQAWQSGFSPRAYVRALVYQRF